MSKLTNQKENVEMKILVIVRRIWMLYAPFRLPLVGMLAVLFAQQFISALSPIFVGKLVTAATNTNARMFVYVLIGWAAFLGVRVLVTWAIDKIDIKYLDYNVTRHLSRVSMEKFFNISMGQHHIGHSVIKRSVISKGESSIYQTMNMFLYNCLQIIFALTIPVVFLLFKAPLIGTSVVVALICYLVYTIKFNNRFKDGFRSLDTLDNMVSRKHGEMINNAEVVYVNSQEDRVRGECDDGKREQVEKAGGVWMSYTNWFFSGQWFVTLARSLCIGLAGYMVFHNQIDAGMFITVVMWVEASLGSLWNISNIQRNLNKFMPQIDKYFRFLDYEPDIVVPEKPVPMTHLRGRIEFRHVSFAYAARKEEENFDGKNQEASGDAEEPDTQVEIPALKDVSLVLEEGKRYAFVGRSGAGKSTMVGLILRAHDPQEGHVLIDGVDIRMLDYRELRRRTGFVPQEVSLFDGTIKYNVLFGLSGEQKDVTAAELESVAKLSRISEFFEKLEDGWETVIGERGIKLSGGQRQRVGIARALVKKPQILIFDEATSHLDTENEAAIRESINEASVGKTTIIIAHRLATVRDADKIFVFDDGRLVGEGTHEALLEGNEFYQRLVKNQVIAA